MEEKEIGLKEDVPAAEASLGTELPKKITKEDFRFVPQVYKTMLTRLKQGEYIIQNPIFRSLLNIKFPKPIYKYHND